MQLLSAFMAAGGAIVDSLQKKATELDARCCLGALECVKAHKITLQDAVANCNSMIGLSILYLYCRGGYCGLPGCNDH